MAKLIDSRYGKARVRVMKLDRSQPQHQLLEWTVRVLLEGDFETAHTVGDNSNILPTDTMKNTVYSRAKESKAETPEEFAIELAEFLLGRNPQVHTVEVKIETAMWKRLVVDGKPHGSSFMRGSDELGTVLHHATRETKTMVCGVENMVILKSQNSSFEGYIQDDLTTLKPTADRLFATAMTADWDYTDGGSAFAARREAIREAMLKAFAEHDSKSVQQTLYAMAEAAMAAVPAVNRVHMVMPNKHCLLVDLKHFGQENNNEIFVPTEDPHGYIEATVVRE
ncbi:factor-independent urate hydroxylase [Terriglobus saanensis]|uniref:Uricase n=1 Tax=Terriglobus saanensis (strain ATCC BAA-1853 / DSM 23119 / SP1PR4) TaxID=401053 RepID=E8UXZ9_TERSS|nr:urate oxidase [Terriglobus saanensis]ADV84233.1 urate oxidase [Terriglobus saanensis SP1PR4]